MVTGSLGGERRRGGGWGGPLGSNIKDSRGAALSLTLIANPLKVIAIDNKVIDGWWSLIQALGEGNFLAGMEEVIFMDY